VSSDVPDIHPAYPLFVNQVLKFGSGIFTYCAFAKEKKKVKEMRRKSFRGRGFGRV